MRAASRATVDEGMPESYKDVATVVDVAEGAGIARKVARIEHRGGGQGLTIAQWAAAPGP